MEGIKLNMSSPGAKLKDAPEGHMIKKITSLLRRTQVNSVIIRLGENDIYSIIGSYRLKESKFSSRKSQTQ